MNRTSTAWSGLCLLALVAFASGAWATSVEFSPDQLTFQKTDTNTQNVGIFVKNFPAGTDLGGALFLLQYDTNALEISNVVFDNTILDLKGLDTPMPGGLSISANKLMATGTVSDAKALVTFDVKRKTDTAGDYPVTFAVGDPLNALKDLVTQDIAVASWGTLTVTVTEGPPDPVQDLGFTFTQRQKDPVEFDLTWTTGKVTSVEAQRFFGGVWETAPAGMLNWNAQTKKLTVTTGVPGVETFPVRLRGLDQGKVWDGTAAVDAAANPDVGWVNGATDLTVDNEPPDLTSAVANRDGTKITATFQSGEILDDATALAAGNYAASVGDPPDAPAATLINVTNVTKLGDNQVELTLASALPREGDLFLGAWNVQDDLGNAMVGTDVVPVTLPAFPPTDVTVSVNAPRQKDPIKGTYGWTNGFSDDAEAQYSDDGGANWHPFDATSDNVNKTWEWNTGFAGTKALDLRVRFLEKGQVWNGTAVVDAATNPDAGWVTAGVILDNEAPVPQSASGAGNLVSIAFKTDEALDPGSVANLANYEVVDMGVITTSHAGALPITEARLAAGTQNVIELVLGENLLPTQRYQVSVKDVVDAVGNAQLAQVDLALTTEPKPGKNVAVVLNAGARQKDDVVIDLTWTDGFATALELQYDAGAGFVNAAGTVADIGAKKIVWNTGFAGTTALQVRARVVHRGKVWDGTQNVDAAANPNAGWSAPVALTVDNELPDPVSAAGQRDSADVVVTFNAGELLDETVAEDLASYTVTDEGVITANGSPVLPIASANLEAAGNVVTLTLQNVLAAGKKYKVTVNAAKDVAGNELAAPEGLDFEVPANPELVSAVFVNRTRVRATFDKVMDIATLGAADWTLTAAGGGTVAVTNVSDTGDGKSFNLTTGLLAQKTDYTLTAPPNAADTGGLTVRPDKDEATFTSRRWFDFAAGTRTIGIPLTDAGRVLTLTGADGVARYDAGAGAYVIDKAVGGAEEIQQVPGMGYFAKFNAARTAYFDGDPLPSPVAFNAPAGWSIISPPRNISLGNINPAIPYAWYYDGTGYVLKANIPAGGLNVVDDKLDAWKGYFIKRAAAGNVQIGTAQASAAPLSFGDDAKLVQLVASAGDLADTMNFCGIGGDAVEIANPPLVDGAVDLAFAGSGDALAVDVRTGDLAQKWDLVVTTSLPNTAVTVSAPDLSTVPAEYAVILTDKESGKSCYLRTSPGFTFETGADGASRKMTLEIVQRSGAALVSSMSVQSGPGAAVVTYGLSGPASVTAEVLNIAGRKVRQIVADRVETAGTHTLVWNLSSDAGTAVPRGLYMIVIQARSEDGQQVRAVRPLSVNR